jgi:adenylate kinase
MSKPPYKLILIGAPGSGQGTQAQRLLEIYGAKQISTGDILRQAVKDASPLGEKAKTFMNDGKLVPDELIIDLIKETLGKGSFPGGWVLDGFPRTVGQAKALDSTLSALGEKIQHVLVLDVPRELLLERIIGRRSCPKCGNVHHVKYSPPKVEGVCDRCKTALVQRPDDTEEKATTRQDAFAAQTAEVIPHYETKGIVTRLDGTQSPDSVFSALEKALGARV